jgi:hypothetical protein
MFECIQFADDDLVTKSVPDVLSSGLPNKQVIIIFDQVVIFLNKTK